MGADDHMVATLTITDLLRACDEPDVDRFLVLSQLADAYADAGDVLRSDAARWMAERGKWPVPFYDGRLFTMWGRLSIGYNPEHAILPGRWYGLAVWNSVGTVGHVLKRVIDAYAELGGHIEYAQPTVLIDMTHGQEPYPKER